MFLSQLDKINNPISELSISLSLEGCFNLPSELVTTEEANPGLFKYSLKYLNYHSEGQYQPRVLSLREQLKNQNAKT